MLWEQCLLRKLICLCCSNVKWLRATQGTLAFLLYQYVLNTSLASFIIVVRFESAALRKDSLLERLDFDTTRTHAPLLTSCPELHYLAQGQQFLPVLTLLEPAQIVGGCAGLHPLRVLTIPWVDCAVPP